MIPLRDSTRSRRFPYVTIFLIVMNIYIYYGQFTSTQDQIQDFIFQYAFIPALLSERLAAFSWLGFLDPRLVTSAFLHGSWFHVLFNMLYLWVFGDNIEDKLGHRRFLILYLLAGIAGNIAHYFVHPTSPIPLVGASGAVAGILGAYFITFPKARVTSLIIIVFFVMIRDIPATVFLLVWFLMQVINGMTSVGLMGNPVAWWAHIGGFLAGIVLMFFLRRKQRNYFSP